MLVERHHKAGSLCAPAKAGELHCPLNVRGTSEDVVTGQIVQLLSLIDPRHWVSDLLNAGLRSNRFVRQHYRSFRIDTWVKKPPFPRELLKWDEGATEVDLQLRWENPPTTVFIEAKYGSKLSTGTANNDGQHGYPSDQLIRNIRVGLHECGYYREAKLFDTGQRDFVVLVLAPDRTQPVVESYRCPSTLRKSIPHAERIEAFPHAPFVGSIGYADLISVLNKRMQFLTSAERRAAAELITDLTYKHQTRPARTALPLASLDSH